MPLPHVLTSADLPSPELQSMRLDGEVYRLAEGWCAIDEIETPQHRLTAVRGDLSARLIAELSTAAWVWGATPVLPSVIEFCADLGARARLRPGSAVRVREVVLDPIDIVQLARGRVTSPLRTIVDLARFRDPLTDDESDAILALADLDGIDLDDCRQLMDRRRNLSEKRRATARLTQLLSRSKLSQR